jgi:hypothetical protein
MVALRNIMRRAMRSPAGLSMLACQRLDTIAARGIESVLELGDATRVISCVR